MYVILHSLTKSHFKKIRIQNNNNNVVRFHLTSGEIFAI